MKDYLVTVRATIERTFSVEAKNKNEAINVAKITEFSEHTDLIKYHWTSAVADEMGKPHDHK